MASTREIVTKAVLGKGKRTFSTTNSVTPEVAPSTILGCWVINHTFSGHKNKDRIEISGSYDVNIWYSCFGDTKTEVVRDSNTYREVVNIKRKEDSDVTNEEIIVRSLKQPSCIKAEIVDGKIVYTIEKELGIELVGDTKVKIAYDEEEDPWDDLVDDNDFDVAAKQIDEEVKENYL